MPPRSLRSTLALAVYSTLLRLLTPLYFLRLWWRGRKEPAYRSHWAERLALDGPATSAGVLWLHAVSLGETRAAAALIAALRERRPDLRLLLTHSTATGRAAGEALLQPGDAQTWFPYDTPGAVRRFLDRHRPALCVLMETEIWPNLQAEAARAHVPVILANARLSAKSALRGQALQALMRPAVERLTLVLAQTEGDAARLRAAGAPSVQVCGNVKFDAAPSPQRMALGRAWRDRAARPVVLAASTREGEEEPLLERWLAQATPRPLLVVVPRHPQRFDAVAQLIAARGLQLHRRSAWGDVPPVQAARADVWLGDTLGEMALYYALADVALLGGSFAPLGGQNLIEAAACGCPIVMGPHTFNFAEAAELALQAGAALRVGDIDAGVALAVSVAGDPQRLERVESALAFAAAHRGAAARMAAEIVKLF